MSYCCILSYLLTFFFSYSCLCPTFTITFLAYLCPRIVVWGLQMHLHFHFPSKWSKVLHNHIRKWFSRAQSTSTKVPERVLCIGFHRIVAHCMYPWWGCGVLRQDSIEWTTLKMFGKKRADGFCVYINNDLFTDHTAWESYRSVALEYLLLKFRPFYLPREFSVGFIVAFCVPPQANAKLALAQLHTAITKQQDTQPNGAFIVAGDFNQVNPWTVLHNFYQHVQFSTRGSNILDHLFTNLKGSYRAFNKWSPRPGSQGLYRSTYWSFRWHF